MRLLLSTVSCAKNEARESANGPRPLSSDARAMSTGITCVCCALLELQVRVHEALASCRLARGRQNSKQRRNTDGVSGTIMKEDVRSQCGHRQTWRATCCQEWK